MPIETVIVKMLVTPIVSALIKPLFSLIFGDDSKHDYNQENLEKFLNILSKDFAEQVRKEVRAAFFENKLDELKENILTSHATLKRFRVTKTINQPSGDMNVLNSARLTIDTAYSILKVQMDKILSVEKQSVLHMPSFLKMIELTLTVIECLFVVDSDISAEYIDVYTQYNAIALNRIDDYILYADSLLKLLKDLQPLRVQKTEKKCSWSDAFEKEYNLMKSVYPSKPVLIDRVTFWAFRIDNDIEVLGCTNVLPTNYSAYNALYTYNSNLLKFMVCATSQEARHEPDKVSKKIADELVNRSYSPVSYKVESVKELLIDTKKSIEYGANYNFLISILQDGSEEAINSNLELITNTYKILNQIDRDTVFCLAVRVGNYTLTSVLITAGATIKAQDEDAVENKENILFLAVRSGSIETVRLFITNNKIDLNAKNLAGMDITDVALESDFQEIASIIEQEKLDRLLKNYSGKYSFHFHCEIIKIRAELLKINAEHPVVTLFVEDKWWDTHYHSELHNVIKPFVFSCLIMKIKRKDCASFDENTYRNYIHSMHRLNLQNEYIDPVTGDSFLGLVIKSSMPEETMVYIASGLTHDLFARNNDNHTLKDLAIQYNKPRLIAYIEELEKKYFFHQVKKINIIEIAWCCYNGFDINTKFNTHSHNEHETVLFFIARKLKKSESINSDYIHLFAALVLRGADVNIRNAFDKTVFDILDSIKDLKISKLVSDIRQNNLHGYKTIEDICPLSYFDSSNEEKLYQATITGDIHRISGLIQHGAKANHRIQSTSETALHAAIRLYDHYEPRDNFGHSPKHPSKEEHIIEALMATCWDKPEDILSIKDKNHRNPIALARYYGKKRVVDYLSVKLKDRFSTIVSVQRDVAKAHEIIQLANDSGINLVSTGEHNLLVCAVSGNCSVDMLRLLLEYGFNIHAKNYDNLTPREIAVKLGYQNLVEYIDVYTVLHPIRNTKDYIYHFLDSNKYKIAFFAVSSAALAASVYLYADEKNNEKPEFRI